MIRSSSASLKFVNAGKMATLYEFLAEYKKAVVFYTNKFWDNPPQNKFATKEEWSHDVNLSATAKQNAAKQALDIVRTTKAKFNRRAYVIAKKKESGDLIGAARLQAIQDKSPIGKPVLKSINAELDSRFVKISLNKITEGFDLWVTVKRLGVGGKPKIIEVPLRRNKHFNKLLLGGKLLPCIRLTDNEIIFFFNKEMKNRTEGTILGIDIGSKKTFSTSDGQQTPTDNHGWTMTKIQEKIARCKKGGENYKRASAHRKNFVRWALNQVDLSGVAEIKIERLQFSLKGKRITRFQQAWTYGDIVGALELKCEELGVLVTRVPPEYTSQRCHKCGRVEESARKGEVYSCKCGYVGNADINAACNIASLSPKVKQWERSATAKSIVLPNIGAYSPDDSKIDDIVF